MLLRFLLSYVIPKCRNAPQLLFPSPAGIVAAWYPLSWKEGPPFQGHYLEVQKGEAIQQLADEIDKTIVAEYFKKICWNWLEKNYHSCYWDGLLKFDDPKKRDVVVNSVRFDYVQETKDHIIYVKIWDNVREGFPKEAFKKIESATTLVRLFYDNIYYLFSAGRACNYVEELRHLDTAAVVDLKSLIGSKMPNCLKIKLTSVRSLWFPTAVYKEYLNLNLALLRVRFMHCHWKEVILCAIKDALLCCSDMHWVSSHNIS